MFPTKQYTSNLNHTAILKQNRSILDHAASLFKNLESLKMELLPLKYELVGFNKNKTKYRVKHPNLQYLSTSV